MGQFQYLNVTFADQNGSVTNLTSTLGSNVLSPTIYSPVGGLSSVSFFGSTTVNTGASGTFTAATSDICTKSSHGFFTGLVVRVSTSSALPTPLLVSTDYFVIRIDANTFYLADSLVHALGASHIDITDTGTGTQTVTPTAIAGASIALRGSFDYGIAATPNWVTIPNTSTTITATSSFGPIELDYIRYPNIQAYAAMTAGSMTFSPIQIGYQGPGA